MDSAEVVTPLVLPKRVEVLATSLAVFGARGVEGRILAAGQRKPRQVLDGRVDDYAVHRARLSRYLGQAEGIGGRGRSWPHFVHAPRAACDPVGR